MTLLVVASLLLVPPPFDWQATADKIAPHIAGLNVSQIGIRESCNRFTRILGKLGMRASYDPAQKKQKPGLYIQVMVSIATSQPNEKACLAFVSRRADPKENYYDDGGALMAFLWKGRKAKGYVLASDRSGEELILPESAARLGKDLVISGLHNWFGNGAQIKVQSYRLDGGKWRLRAEKTAEFESWGSSGVRLSKDGSRFMPVRIQSRTSPKFLEAGHATAHLSYIEEWRFLNGIPKLAWKRLRDTPYNALDDLYRAIKQRDCKTIAFRSSDKAIAHKLVSLYPMTQKGYPVVEFVNSYCDSDAKVLAVENLCVWFHFAKKNGKWVVAKLSRYKEPEE